MPIDYTQLKTHLWSAADELGANSRLRSHEYSTPVLGVIFLRYADVKFGQVYEELKTQSVQQSSRRRQLRLFDSPVRCKAEGQRGGEFFTPTSLVKLIVEVIEPYHGQILDPACGSGGMFVHSAQFMARHQKNPGREISLYGQEKTEGTVGLAKMNLAITGLEGQVGQGNTYYEDLHLSLGRFDFVMANPPFNVNNVDKDRLKNDPRFPFGMPRADNANYLRVQIFFSALQRGGSWRGAKQRPTQLDRDLSRRRVPGRARPVQSGHPGRNRSPGLEPESRSLSRCGRPAGR